LKSKKEALPWSNEGVGTSLRGCWRNTGDIDKKQCRKEGRQQLEAHKCIVQGILKAKIRAPNWGSIRRNLVAVEEKFDEREALLVVSSYIVVVRIVFLW